MASKLKWAILGTGKIAHTFAKGLLTSQTGELYAVGSRTLESARKFGDEFNAPKCFGSYEETLADPEVNCVYISMPHTYHVEWSIKAAEAGKHILCEKPMALNQHEAHAVFDAVRRNNVFFMEAFMYRCHPQTLKLAELVREKMVGDVRMIRASFSFSIPFDPQSRLLSNALAGGGILDVGCYPVTAANLLAGAALGLDFAEPIEFKASGHLGETGVDEYTAATAKYAGGIIAQLSCGVRCEQEWVIIIYGTEGQIRVSDPWIPSKEGGTTRIIVQRVNEPERYVEIVNEHNLYGLEADEVGRNVLKRQSPRMSWEDSLASIRTLDRWRSEIGLVYDVEKPGKVPTASGRALSKRSDAAMTYARIPGVDKEISRVVIGTDFMSSAPQMAALIDAYIERGGNTIDTAFKYQHGVVEALLGQYLKSRNLRDKVVLIGKAAHSPENVPSVVEAQVKHSLESLQTESLDIFFLHRDNAAVPVGEWVDVVNDQVRAGRIRGAIGVSNWMPARIDEANAYAKKRGLRSFTTVSNSLSLARPMEPLWPGCVHVSDDEQLAWFQRTRTPLFSWSCQARGFFSDSVAMRDASNPWVARCWNTPGNWLRKQRAEELAKKRGVQPTQIALAFVLQQTFPTFAVIGPRNIKHLAESMAAANIELTADEVKWLNLE